MVEVVVTSELVWCTAVAGSTWRYNVLQVLSDGSQHCSRRLYQWPACALGYLTACWPPQAVEIGWQGHRYVQLAGTFCQS